MSHNKVFWKQAHVGMEPSKTNQTRWEWHHNNSHRPYILRHFTVTYTNMHCVCVQRRTVEGSVMGSAVHVDVHGEWFVVLLRATCLTLEIIEFRCYEVKTEVECWRLKSEVSWVWLPVTASFFTFLYFCLITSKYIWGEPERAPHYQVERWIFHLYIYMPAYVVL